MDVQQFLAEFGHIASAPNGVQRLREMVLQLAVMGKLVEHNAQDGNVEQELAAARKERALREDKIGRKSPKNEELNQLAERPYPIPSHWRWVALGDFALYIQRGKGPNYADRGQVQVISQKCVQWTGFDPTPARWIDDRSINGYGNERFLQPNDLLWNSTGTGTVGRVAIFPGFEGKKMVADSHITYCAQLGI